MFTGAMVVKPIFRVTEQYLVDSSTQQKRKFVAGSDAYENDNSTITLSQNTRILDACDLKNSLVRGEVNYLDDTIEVSIDGGQSYNFLTIESDVEIMNYLNFLIGKNNITRFPLQTIHAKPIYVSPSR